MSLKKVFIAISAAALGFLIVSQIRSFSGVDEFLARDSQSNVFMEIRILKEKNDDLKGEISGLESGLKSLNDQNLALEVIDKEIEKYTKLSGKSPIFGPGISVSIDSKITTPWMIDLINEFFNSGAQAVSVNGMRITNQTSGFDTLPQGQIFLNSSILSFPYVFNVIGEPSTIETVLTLPGGIFDRIMATFPGVVIETIQKEIIQMD